MKGGIVPFTSVRTKLLDTPGDAQTSYSAMLFPIPAQIPAPNLAWLTRQVVRTEGPPPMDDNGALGAFAVDTIEALEGALAKYGRKPAILDLLGRANLAAGNYADALPCFEASGNKKATETTRILLSRKMAFEFKHVGRRVLHIKTLTGYRSPVVAILHVRNVVGTGESFLGPAVQNVKLTLSAGATSVTLGPFKRLDFDFDEANEAQLYAIDMDRDGKQEAVISGVFYGASWTPSFMSVVGQANGKWTKTREVDSHDPMWVQDLNRDGKWEFGGVNAIGMTLSHAEQPRWLEIYRYRAGSVVPADTDFPAQYRSYVEEIDALLKQHPEDGMLLAYRGRTAMLLGRRSEARTFEKRALRHLSPNDGLTAKWVQRIVWRPFDPTRRLW